MVAVRGDIELPDGPRESDALAAVLRGREDEARRALREMNYAELYCLRAGLEKLYALTCARLEITR